MSKSLELYYATNRAHVGKRWTPTRYEKTFSKDGRENLRFGKVEVDADETAMKAATARKVDFGTGNGQELSTYLAAQTKATQRITAFAEKVNFKKSERHQDRKAFGSTRAFQELQETMLQSTDVVIYVHGYNQSWEEAVGAALALQEMLNRSVTHAGQERPGIVVVLFSWPSDGSMVPFKAYASDRTDARDSGGAVGRAFLKLRDFLLSLRPMITADMRPEELPPLCNQEMHLLCHSMGNYVLQNALERMVEFSHGPRLPRLFKHIFLCAPDVDDHVLQPGQPMGNIGELARQVTVYFNAEDAALHISDITKGNPERLGSTGMARPGLVHSKIQQVNCTAVVTGLVEHSYYLDGLVNDDILLSVAGVPTEDLGVRKQRRPGPGTNCWVLAGQ